MLALKEIINQTDYKYLVSLSSKTYVLGEKRPSISQYKYLVSLSSKTYVLGEKRPSISQFARYFFL